MFGRFRPTENSDRDRLGRFHKPGDEVKPKPRGKQSRPNRRVRYLKSCEWCGKVFTAHISLAKTCSSSCRQLKYEANKVKLTSTEASKLEQVRHISPRMDEFLNAVERSQGQRGLKQALYAMNDLWAVAKPKG